MKGFSLISLLLLLFSCKDKKTDNVKYVEEKLKERQFSRYY